MYQDMMFPQRAITKLVHVTSLYVQNAQGRLQHALLFAGRSAGMLENRLFLEALGRFQVCNSREKAMWPGSGGAVGRGVGLLLFGSLAAWRLWVYHLPAEALLAW